MTEEKTYTQAEAHRFFAADLNGVVWTLLEKADRTPEEDEVMIHAAHGSCYHWLQAGTAQHHQRGEWLLSRVYAVLRMGDAALRYAERCLALTEQHRDLMQDFDRAYAYEALARANAIAGNRQKALKVIQLAQEAGEAIASQEDRDYFMSDFDGGDWNGMK